MRRTMALLFGFLFVAGGLLALEPIRYIVSIPDPRTHYVEVEAQVPSDGRPSIELKMAVWTQYVVREYARNVEAVTARTPSGAPLHVEKIRKNRWRVDTGGASVAGIHYRVYCHVLHVQDNWVSPEFAFLNGAPTFLTIADGSERPHEVRLVLPRGWGTAVSAMPAGEGANTFLAASYEELVDSPILAGNPALYRFTVDGKEHVIANQGEDGMWNGRRGARDIEKIVREHARMWGGLPYSRYVFLFLMEEIGGGMEHSGSTAIGMSRWAATQEPAYLEWLNTVSHEFFHVWNVKRLRPAGLTPGEYETEPYTPSLGISEGFTSYYGPLAVRRAGLSGDAGFLHHLSREITTLQNRPGRLVQSLNESSFDTWIKFYRPDENSRNTTVSYYNKGAVVAFLLDARIRALSGGARSLDDAMRLALRNNPVERGFHPEDFERACSETAGKTLSDFFEKAFNSTEELDYTEALQWYGLRFQPQAPADSPSMGAALSTEGGHLVISSIDRGSAAEKAGLDTGDQILGINGFAVSPQQWSARLASFHTGDRIALLVSRRQKEFRIPLTLQEDAAREWTLGPDPNATPEQRAHREEWLRGRYKP